MKHFTDFIAACLTEVNELFPWDLAEKIENGDDILMLDVREPNEFDALHIKDSLNVPRGILESSCEWDYDETIPELVQAREREVIVICRSGNRSVLAAHVKTGVRGWNDFEQPLYDKDDNLVDIDDADEVLASRVREDQRRPN